MTDHLNVLFNDPSTAIHGPSPEAPDSPTFSVQGYTRGRQHGTLQIHAAQVHATLAVTLRYAKDTLRQPLLRWAATSNLIVLPHAGADFNAYYDRDTLRFFFSEHPETHKMVFSCESMDIVSHELGHAILDSIRPDLWNATFTEIFAFHEAFGDIMALLTVLQSDAVIEKVLAETNNDLTKSNIASRLAEEMGNAIYTLTRGKMANPDSLRNAANNYKYSIPENLPRAVDDDEELAQEPHNFSRVFVGAWYDCLVSIFKKSLEKGVSPVESLRIARDVMGRVTLNALPMAAANARFFESVALAMLAADREYNSGNDSHTIRQVFTERNILRPQIYMANRLGMKLDKEVFHHLTVLEHGKTLVGRLKNRLVSAVTLNHLSPEVEAPNERQVEMDSEFRVIHEHVVDTETAKKALAASLQWLENGDHVSKGPDYQRLRMFSVEDGKLVRNRFCC